MKWITFGLLLIGTQLLAQSASTFSYKGQTLKVIEYRVLPSPIEFDSPVTDSDDEQIRIFKSYFNPGSFEAFSSHYLDRDWFHPSTEEYLQWQQTIREKRLALQAIIHLQHGEGEYLVYQYILKTPGYEIYQSSEFKLTSSGWKHTSQQNDAIADFLNRIGTVEISYYLEQAKTSNKIQLDALPTIHQRTYVEVFDRAAIFPKIETMLLEKGVAQTDIDHARTLFVYKDDMGFIEQIASQYKFDDIDFMSMVNKATGIQLFRSSRIPQD